jgi:hypothetical protein
MSLLLLTLDVGPAYACSCMDVPLKNDIRDADAVFSGEVRSIDEEAPGGRSGIMAAPGRISFAVEDSWKGGTAETVDVYGQGTEPTATTYSRRERPTSSTPRARKGTKRR